MAYVTREGFLQEELLTEHIVPGYLTHTVYVDINFLLFSLPLCCAETFEMEVMHLCLFTFKDEIVVF